MGHLESPLASWKGGYPCSPPPPQSENDSLILSGSSEFARLRNHIYVNSPYASILATKNIYSENMAVADCIFQKWSQQCLSAQTSLTLLMSKGKSQGGSMAWCRSECSPSLCEASGFGEGRVPEPGEGSDVCSGQKRCYAASKARALLQVEL